MRTLLLIALLLSACLPEDEVSISQSGATKGHDLTNVSSSSYIEQDECLIEVSGSGAEGELALGDEVVLKGGTCLPSSKLSWLFRAQEVTETKLKNLSLAILFDTSYSLNTTDPNELRYTYFKINYLLPLRNEIKKAGEGVSATIKVYPFKYCNKAIHDLTIDANTTNDEIDNLINDLREHGVKGSTNYLPSFAEAADFLNNEDDKNLKQLLIVSDGLPFTFNDGNTDTITCDVKDIVNKVNFPAKSSHFDEYVKDENLGNCILKENYPIKNKCKPPRGHRYKNDDETIKEFGDMGVGYISGKYGTDNLAFNDPYNHILGMIQHSSVMKKTKHNFDIYALLLQVPCEKMKAGEDNKYIHEINLCKNISPLAKPFIESFTDEHLIIHKAEEFAYGLAEILKKQTSFEYKKHGKAYIGASKGNKITVDEQTTWHNGNLIKVGRDGASGVGKGATGETVHDYINDAQSILTVEHGLQGKSSKDFTIDYDFTFGSIDKCRNENPITEGNLEVNEYKGTGYTAWCLLSPRCDAQTQCCDPNNRYQVVNEQAQQGICQSKGKYWQWVGFSGKQKVCNCVCDADGRGRAACRGKTREWNPKTCTCDTVEAETEPEPEPEPACTSKDNTATYCCKNGEKKRQPACGKGQNLDISACKCIETSNPSPPATPPVQHTCNPASECCTKNNGVWERALIYCPAGKKWAGFSTCKCVCDPAQVCCHTTKADCNLQTHNWKGHPTCSCTEKRITPPVRPPTKPDPIPPDKNGKVIGEEDAKPAAAEGIVWGEYESF